MTNIRSSAGPGLDLAGRHGDVNQLRLVEDGEEARLREDAEARPGLLYLGVERHGHESAPIKCEMLILSTRFRLKLIARAISRRKSGFTDGSALS